MMGFSNEKSAHMGSSYCGIFLSLASQEFVDTNSLLSITHLKEQSIYIFLGIWSLFLIIQDVCIKK